MNKFFCCGITTESLMVNPNDYHTIIVCVRQSIIFFLPIAICKTIVLGIQRIDFPLKFAVQLKLRWTKHMLYW